MLLPHGRLRIMTADLGRVGMGSRDGEVVVRLGICWDVLKGARREYGA